MTITNSVQKTGNPNVIYSASTPPNVVNDQIWIDAYNSMYVQKNNIWVPISGSASGGNVIAMQSHMLTVNPYVTSTSGAGSNIQPINDPGGRPGILQIVTGTTTTGFARIYTTSNICLGQGWKWYFDASVRIPILSTSTETFTFGFGICNAAPPASNQVAFQYTHGSNSGNLTFVCRKAGTQTLVDTGINVVANSWYRLSAFINSDSTLAEGYVDRVIKASINSNIPNLNTQPMNFADYFSKSAGTTSRNQDVDYMNIFGIADNPVLI